MGHGNLLRAAKAAQTKFKNIGEDHLTGSLWLRDTAADSVFNHDAAYNGSGSHVEDQLSVALEKYLNSVPDKTKLKGFKVVIYCYYSPCYSCATLLKRLSARWEHLITKWKFSYNRLWYGGEPRPGKPTEEYWALKNLMELVQYSAERPGGAQWKIRPVEVTKDPNNDIAAITKKDWGALQRNVDATAQTRAMIAQMGQSTLDSWLNVGNSTT